MAIFTLSAMPVQSYEKDTLQVLLEGVLPAVLSV
jgi:hypothetical protein